eukprot:gnl/Chilomastix_caulleri/219.p1 GENE.gnl/Chilomastix_caulleri/219~~gnl/Chilomastix_caulleri/219.p1  ORF type:complete len:219 (+),score=38.33 gnl/Chilomastix_caulleri/219:58-714(+)
MGMRHNYALSDKKRPKQHGMYKLTLDSPMRKLRRRQHRREKAAEVFPRPVNGPLRPEVRCPTQRYNLRSRLGRGFTRKELLAAGINPLAARSLGISYDTRRRNHSRESLNANVNRLKYYKTKLVVFPRKDGKQLKNINLSKDKTIHIGKNIDTHNKVYSQKVFGLKTVTPHIKTVEVTKNMKDLKAFVTLKKLKKERRNVGKRLKHQALLQSKKAKKE